VIARWANYTWRLRLGPFGGKGDRRRIGAAVVRSSSEDWPGVRLRVALFRLRGMTTVCGFVAGDQAHQTMCRTRQERGHNGKCKEATHGNAEQV